ncbi:MAG: transporter substrate-binding domain-containing protein, partial [Bacteroidota bacterium]
MRKFTVVFLLFFFFAPLIFAQQNNPIITHFNQEDSIVIASEPDYPPYCIVDENGNADGFSVELIKAAAEAVGLHVEIRIGVWNRIKNRLADGEIDALPLVGRTPEREEVFDFTMPYLSLHGAVFVRKGTTGINSLEDLKGKEIAVMEGDNAEEFVRRDNISDKIFTTTTFEEAFQNLANGQYDAVITQRITGMKLIEELELRTLEPLKFQLPQFRQDFCFAVQEGNSALLNRLNEGLSIVIANGTYDDIKTKWLGPDDEWIVAPYNLARILLFIFIPLVAVFVASWIIFLRKEVKKRTRVLKEEISKHKATMQELRHQQFVAKSNETQIRLLLNSTAEGLYAIDTNGHCTLINQSALEMLGFSTKNEVLGENMHDLIHHTKPDGTKYPKNDCLILRAFQAGTGTHSDMDMLWRKDGTGFPAEYFSYPIRQNDAVTGLVVTFWDITERKKAESELLQLKNDLEIKVAERTAELEDKVQKLHKSQKAMLYMVEDLNNITTELKEQRRLLEYSNNELEAFTYSVSHDLRAPLRAINGFASFLAEDYADKLDDEGKRFLETIRANADKMDLLIFDLLNLSRVSRADLKHSDVDMMATAKKVFEETATEDEKSSFELTIHPMPEVKCDQRLIWQVWQNLIGNALKYSSKSDIKKVEIGTIESENDNEIVFYVKDYGAGFDPKYKDKLFGVFQRLHKEDEFEGTGVGLAISKRIIFRHGGRIWAEGEVGKGAVF